MEIERTVCENVKNLRLRQNLTQEDVAYNAQLSVSHLSKVERGVTSPTVKTLGKIAKALDVHIDNLFSPIN